MEPPITGDGTLHKVSSCDGLLFIDFAYTTSDTLEHFQTEMHFTT